MKASAAADDKKRETRIVEEKGEGFGAVATTAEGFIGAQVSTCHRSYICSARF